jgi:hypothetical protein
MRRSIRVFAVLLTLVVLAAGAVRAMPSMARSARVSESEGVLARIWGWLSALFLVEGSMPTAHSVWEREGSHIDPNGEH